MHMASKVSVLDILTQKVTDALNKGTVLWHKPWKGGWNSPRNMATNRPYNGLNALLLSFMNFSSPYFMTYNQIHERGGTIKPDQTKLHNPVFYWNWVTKDRVTGDPLKKAIPFMRYYRVWNLDQVDGIEAPKREPMPEIPAIDAAEAVIANMPNPPKIVIKDGGNRACYTPVLDMVTMPKRDQFDTAEHYYQTMFHELGHSTGHKSRLNRKEVMDFISFGSHNYSLEELVAEMTACFLAGELNLNLPWDNSANYIANWYGKLKTEPRLFATAAARAQKAFDYIMNRKADEKGAETLPGSEDTVGESE
jgi:antirestriction protein ArdC